MITSTMPPQQMARVLGRHCEACQIAESRFGRDAVNDPRLIGDLRHSGRHLRLRTVERINAALQRGA